MKFYVLSGSDTGTVAARRSELIDAAVKAGGTREDTDVGEDAGGGLVGAVSSPGLFSPTRVVVAENFDAISDGSLERLVTLAEGSDATVVARTSVPPTAALKRKAPFAEFEVYKLPAGKGATKAAVDLFEAAGITVDASCRRVLSGRSKIDLERVRGVVTQLQMAAITQPTGRQLDVLLGAAPQDSVPWVITDALDRNDVRAAVAACAHAEPIPAIAYLRSRVQSAARAIECGTSNADTVAELTGMKPYSAKQAVALGRRLGSAGARDAVLILRDADLDARSAVGGYDALCRAVSRLSVVW